MKRRKIVIPIVVIATLIIIVVSQYPKLYLATGYGAKSMATAVFVAERDPQIVKLTDLDYSIVKYTKSVVDYENKSVSTSFWGMAKQTAIYRQGFGCCLIGDLPADSLRKLTFTTPIRKREGVWRLAWPDGDLKKDTVYSKIDTVKLKSAIDAAFDNSSEYKKRTAAVVVIYKGELIAEKYDKELGITQDTRIWGWSMSKSIMNSMAGVLTKQRKLDVNASAPVPQWLKDRRRDITISELMHMSSGLKWDEDYSDVSSATNMLYRSADCYKVAIDVPYQKKPGTEWKYSSGTSNILSGIMRTLIGNDQIYHEFPYREIFNKIGVTSMILETDAAGNFVGSSYSYAAARDWARFGLLYYNDGIWKGDTILPKGWVNYTRTPATASKGEYGAQFWLNRSRKLPDVPEDMYSCNGHRGQRIFIIPSRNLVVVRLGFSETGFNHNEFLKGILASIKKN
ncbi:MAG: serine hydrolase [Bacteroidia bacterium]|nr:serine hydrolase [Bacteroidia bacterium]